MAVSAKRFKVLVTHPELPQAGIEVLQKECDVKICKSIPPSLDEICEECKGVDAILWAGHEPLDDRALNAAGPQLKAISTYSAGIDFAKLEDLKRRKIPLGHTPTVLNDAVADVAVGLMVAAARRFHEGRLKIETSNWETKELLWMLGRDIKGSTVGFVGMGGIAQSIVRRLQGFEVGEFLYTSRNKSAGGDALGAKHVTFDDILSRSDFVILVCPLTIETKNMFNERAFDRMKPTSILINVARGQIVDQNALYHALKDGKIFAAGLDVMTPEPLPSNHELLSLPNCVIIPHLGSATFNTRSAMAVAAAQNILLGLADKTMIYPAYS